MQPSPPRIDSKNISSADDEAGFLNQHSETESLGEGLHQTQEPKPSAKRSKRILKIILVFMVVAAVLLGGFVAIRATNLADKIFVGNNQSWYSRITDLLSLGSGSKLIGESDGQVNVLLLGIGGPGHDGPYLSDTIMVAQLKPNDKRATLISIPRDYLVNTKELGQRKINAVFAETYSKTEDWDKSGQATIDVVEKMSGLEIPYFAVIDFEGFKKTIDLLGGVEVTIDKSFTDNTFPNDSEGYIPAVTFEQGTEVMDGERALIFARSRHAAGSEGSDYARGLRQQKIIHAAKNKLVSLNIIADAGKINELFTIVGEHFHTNLTPGEMIRLYTLTHEYGGDSVSSLSLDPSTNLVCPEVLESNGAFVLTLCPGKNSQDVIDFFKDSFSSGAVLSEKAVVWLADSTVSGQLYKKAETQLVSNGLTVYKVIYTGKPLTQSVVYAVNQKTATIELIKERLNASEVSLAPPGIKIDPTKVDVIIILGEEAQ